MKMRTTKRDLEIKVSRIASLIHKDLTIEYAYGKPIVYIANDDTSVSNLSPRLSKPALWDWLDAFEAGIYYADQEK